MREHWLKLCGPLLVALVTFGVFARALQADFVAWDDNVNIYENPHIQRLDAESLRWMFSDFEQALRYKPLSWLSWALIHAQVGLNPFGYHLANVLLHCLNAALVFLLTRKLCLLIPGGSCSSVPQTYLHVCCSLGALVWAIHPLRVEPVAWATGLPYGQSVFFLLLSFLGYLHANDPSRAVRRRGVLYTTSVAAFALALFSYPIVLAYPLVLFVVDVYPLKRLKFARGQWRTADARRAVLDKLPFLAFSILFVAIALYARLQASGFWHQAVPLTRFGAVSRTIQAFYIWFYYAWKPLLPLDLAPVYTKLISFDPLETPFLLTAYVVITLTLVLIWQRRRWPLALAVWVSHLLLLVPVLGLTERPHFSSDRYCYLAGIVWSVLIAGALVGLPGGSRRWLGVLAALLVTIVLSALTCRQVPVWQNSIALFEHTITTLKDDPFRHSFYFQLAPIYKAEKNYPQALKYYSWIARWRPRHPRVHQELGEVLFQLGRLDEAVEAYETGLKIHPDDERLYCGLGEALLAKGDLEGAGVHLARALELNPDLAAAHHHLSLVLERQGKTAEAKAHARRAVQLGKPAVSP